MIYEILFLLVFVGPWIFMVMWSDTVYLVTDKEIKICAYVMMSLLFVERIRALNRA